MKYYGKAQRMEFSAEPQTIEQVVNRFFPDKHVKYHPNLRFCYDHMSGICAETEAEFQQRFAGVAHQILRRHPRELYLKSWQKLEGFAPETKTVVSTLLDKIEFHISPTCNLSCKWCYGDHLKPAVPARKFLAWQDYHNALASVVQEWGLSPYVVFAGLWSEPLLHPEFDRFMGTVEQFGLRFTIYSNGLRMEKYIQPVLDASLRNKRVMPSSIVFNLSAQVYAKTEDKFLTNLLLLMNANKGNDRMNFKGSFVIPPEGLDFERSVRLLLTLLANGFDGIRISMAWSQLEFGGTKDLSKINEEAAALFEKLKGELGEKVDYRSYQLGKFARCCVMANSVAINSEGLVFPCPETATLLYQESHALGDIKKEKLTHLFGGERYWQVQEYLHRKEKSGRTCTCCPENNKFNTYMSATL